MAPLDNLSCVLYKKGDMRLEQTVIMEPKANEVQVSIRSVGICGSDVHYLVHGAIGKFVVTKPIILGHETAGVVSKVGANVENLKIGDRVALEPGIPCRHCEDCLSGKYNLCSDVVFCATPPHDGTLRRFYCQDAQFCYKLPPNMSLDEGAFIEPLSVAVHSCRRAAIQPGQRVLITGVGPIGLLNMLVAKAFGASRIAVIDIMDAKLALARTLGADAAFNVKNHSDEDIVKDIREALGGYPHATLECSGAESCIRLAIKATNQGGSVSLVGMGPDEVNVPLVEAAIKELNILGVFRYRNCYPTAIELISSGRVNVKPLITHRFPLEEAHRAFETTRTGVEGAIKVIIDCTLSQNK
ncbi:sorbitol dehydrogenase-like isoform X1 [Varroa destructor]|uniref:Sorbitol dehydrogenase n=1 Tax=Varroa destructor TaxID=109461 RepID=A0A7M7J644_VARDE|nr:sorbitol dehydrogenase-like isoform X1 [Varroa destructor]